jgi:parallel beta-helix repeat protein
MLCPYCLKDSPRFDKSDEDGIAGYRCPDDVCRRFLPNEFVREYSSYPPAVFSAVGLSGHGKTCFLYSFLHELGRAVADWPEFSYTPLDERSMADVLEKLRGFADGDLPEPTNVAFPEPVILKLDGVPRIGNLQLFLYDNGGEVFTDLLRLREFAPYLTRTPVVVWLLSLDDLTHPHELLQLLGVYREAMLTLKFDSRNQSLLVVLTKADGIREFREGEGAPESIHSILSRDGNDPEGYSWGGLERLSNEIEHWLEHNAEQANFVRRARKSFAEVRYTVASALGSTPTERRLTTRISPRGVLATLYWLAWYQLPRIALVVGENRMGYLSLEQAIEAAGSNPGATIELGAGTYTLANPTRIQRSVRLVGKGADATRILLHDKAALVVEGPRSFRAEGITFESAGDSWSNILTVSVGEIDLKLCRFSRATTSNAPFTDGRSRLRGGIGLRVRGATRGTIQSCRFVANELCGIYLEDDSTIDMITTMFEGHGQAGAWYAGRSSGSASGCRFARNGRTGVIIASKASPTLEANQSLNNSNHGIRVMDDAKPTLIGNTCSENDVGLLFAGRARGRESNNILDGNRTIGLKIIDEANPDRDLPPTDTVDSETSLDDREILLEETETSSQADPSGVLTKEPAWVEPVVSPTPHTTHAIPMSDVKPGWRLFGRPK